MARPHPSPADRPPPPFPTPAAAFTGILAVALCLAPLPAQFLGPVPATTRADADPPPRVTTAALDAARRNLEEGQATPARKRLVQVLPRNPASEDVLATILEATLGAPEDVAEDARTDLQLMWMHRYAEVLQSRRGKIRWPRALRRRLPFDAAGDDGEWDRLARTRTAALGDLKKLARGLERTGGADRQAAAVLSARLGAELGWLLARRNPEFLADAGEDLWPRFEPPTSETMEALRAVMGTTGAGEGPEHERAVRAAFVLRGLGRQAASEDLRGPDADRRALRDGEAAAEFLATARAASAEAFGEPRTVAALRAMTPAERDAFSARWSDPARPAYAVSPEGLYLVQTHLGHEVLLAAAEQVEDHHRRLVGFYGGDPFAGKQQGVVRIVPDRAGLEGEGAPFWWAGGFQAGNVTTVSFACSTDEALGRVLTHELTHRFDGIFNPFQPAWIAEGRATWTGGAYTGIPASSFVDDFLPVGSLSAARAKGYGRAENLRRILSGEPEDYRDNYPVGASLYVFLRSWTVDGRKLFAERFEAWRKNMRRGQNKPLAWFLENFCDGEDGRPGDLPAFAAMFSEFLEGPSLPRNRRPDWLDDFTASLRTRAGARIYEPRSWIDTRTRTEPWFGQDHAGTALEILHEAGDLEGAAAAAAWSLAVDEWNPARMAVVHDVLARLGRDPEGAWIAGRRAAAGGGLGGLAGAVSPATPWPGLGEIPAVARLCEELRAASAAHAAAGRALTAAWLGLRQRRLADCVGLPLAPLPELTPEQAVLVDEAAVDRWALGVHGELGEDELLGYDDRRVEGLWTRDDDSADLHVGRRERAATTGIERASPRRDAFVLDAPWLFAGRYQLQTRVHFTTALAEMAIVLGHARRERNVLLHLKAGDPAYARGEERLDAAWEGVEAWIGSRFPRDGGLEGASPRSYHLFDAPRPAFDLTVLVDGPAVHVRIDGEPLFSYCTPTGLPIEGRLGVATSRGAVRLQTPTVERLDDGAGTPGWVDLRGLKLSVDDDELLGELVAHRADGIPRAASGVLLAMIPVVEEASAQGDPTLQLATRTAEALGDILADEPRRPPVVVAVPESVDAAALPRLEERGRELLGASFAVRRHQRLSMSDGFPVLVLVDRFGAIRVSREFPPSLARELGPGVLAWMRVLRRPGE